MSLGLERGPGGPADWAAAALALGALIWHLRRARAPLGARALRAAAAGALMLAVARPEFARLQTRREKPRLLILVDDAASMAAPGPDGTRWRQALRWLERARPALESRARVSLALIDERVRPLGGWDELKKAAARGGAFTPAQALDAAAPTRADRIWLLSDGVVDDGGDAARALSALGAPTDALGVGPARRDAGPTVVDALAPDFAFAHGELPVRADIDASGLKGREVLVTLSRADDAAPGGWREAARQNRRVSADDEVFTSCFTAVVPSLGAERWRVEARAGARANAREFVVSVVRQKYRIMYLAGRPSPEYAFLRDFLKSDPNRELVSFVILRNPSSLPPAPDDELSLIPFPAQDVFDRALPQFDLFILENFSAPRFGLPPSALEPLRRFVASGGALLLLGGENAFSAGGYKGTPLEEMLPVTLTGRTPDFSPGLFHPEPASVEHPLAELFDTPESSRRAWRSLPPLDGWADFASVRPGAQVVAVRQGKTTDDGRPLPVIAVRAYGRGKVMLVSTDSTWRWKLGAAADEFASDFYERFWSRAVEYLTGTLDLSKVQFAPIPPEVPAREPFTVVVRVFDSDFTPANSAQTRLELTWTPPGAAPRAVAARETAPGVYEADLTGLSPGLQRLRAVARVRGRSWGESQASFLWRAPQARPMDKPWLARAAAGSGGRFLDLSTTDPAKALALLPAPRPRERVRRTLRPFSSARWLALCAVLLALEWAWRRRLGLA